MKRNEKLGLGLMIHGVYWRVMATDFRIQQPDVNPFIFIFIAILMMVIGFGMFLYNSDK